MIVANPCSQLESALLRLARQILHPLGRPNANGDIPNAAAGAEDDIPDIQVTLRSGMNMKQFRDLTVGPVGSYTSFHPFKKSGGLHRLIFLVLCFVAGRHADKACSSSRYRDQCIGVIVSSYDVVSAM